MNETAPKGNRIRKICELFFMIIGHGDRISYIRESELKNSDYDEVWYYNYCPWFYGIYDLMLSKGKEVNCVAFMESVFTYTYLRNGELKPPVCFREKVLRKGRKVFHKWVHYPYTGDVYVQFPDMTDDDCSRVIHELPVLSPNDTEYIDVVSKVLSTPKLIDLPRYIFMASSLEFDGFGEGETDLIIKVAEIVGKDNIIVKLHPRDKRGIIENAGIRVMESSNVCWEAIQLTNSFYDNVFLTVASASIVNAELFSNIGITAFYLYPLIRKMTPTFSEYCHNSVGATIEKAHLSGNALDTIVINSENELYEVLKK
ncbi:hypothetical protein [Butyrivibrio sp. NC2007]|uniref:hypothetical protein n=1 Tax=Butyrivibrio sp. NC2007 TaxID=1280683 RepID=UPI0018C99F29|nr:hypothetical protein [Butyrivibrio sp. NC2007]